MGRLWLPRVASLNQQSHHNAKSSIIRFSRELLEFQECGELRKIFKATDFLSVNKEEKIDWEDIKHIVISLINDFYSNGKEFVFDKEIDK